MIYTPSLSLENSQEDHFYDMVTKVISKLEKEVPDIAIIVNSNVIDSVEDYEDWHGHYSFIILNVFYIYLNIFEHIFMICFEQILENCERNKVDKKSIAKR